MREMLANALEIFDRHSGWIIWNLFLAFIPWALSFWLFRRKVMTRNWGWWMIYIIFIAFLPNAPYLLTDIIHLIRIIQAGYSVWVITLIFIPLHVFAIMAGLQFYVLSLINQGHYLKRQGVKRYIFAAEIMTHTLCAIGVYLGRFRRFNSWDLVTQPDVVFLQTLDDLTDKKPLFVVIITFLFITISYTLMKQVTLGLILQLKRIYSGLDELDSDEFPQR